MRDLELAKGTARVGVHGPFWNSLSIKVRQVLEKLCILQQDEASTGWSSDL